MCVGILIYPVTIHYILMLSENVDFSFKCHWNTVIVSASWDRSVMRWAHVDTPGDIGIVREKRTSMDKGDDVLDLMDEDVTDKHMDHWRRKKQKTVSLALPEHRRRRDHYDY